MPISSLVFFNRYILLLLTALLIFSGGVMAVTPLPKIVQLGNPILRHKARELSIDEILSPATQALIQTMHDTLRGVGVGLAAPQIGYELQIAIVEDLPEYINRLPIEIREERDRKPIPFHVLINPKIIWKDAEEALFFEGCLSISKGARVTPRAKQITVEFLNEKGERKIVTAKGWYARILQHEIGHLQGTLFIDVSDPRTEVSLEEYKNKWLYARSTDIKKFYNEKIQME